MTTERIQLLILRLLNDAPSQIFTTSQIFGDVNATSAEVVTRVQLERALGELEDTKPPQVFRVPGAERAQGMLTKIAPAGILRVLAAPSDER